MTQNSKQLAEKFEKYILAFSKRIANSRPIIGTCLCGSSILQTLEEKSPLEVLLIIDGFQPKLMNYVKFFSDMAVIFYVVDKRVFEEDVERGLLGEALAIQLIFPYTPLVNAEYLRDEELKLKRRLILEALERLVLDFPELCYEIHIKPEYFLYEAIHSRLKLFPPIRYMLANLLREDVEKENLQTAMEGFLQALEIVKEEGAITHADGYVRISRDFADAVRSRKFRFTNFLKTAQKTLFLSFIGTFPKIFTALLQNKDMLQRLKNFNWETLKSSYHIEDSKKYLFILTANGLTPLAAETGIGEFAKNILSVNKDAKVAIEELGGVFNEVYLVNMHTDGQERKVVVKTFKDWSSLKWLPINIWAFGTRTFALLGQTRLERECATNQFLYRKGFPVPKLLAINHDERLVFMEYIEGKSLEKIIRKIVNAKNEREIDEEYLKILEGVGEIFARVHALNLTLGDTKPENILIGKNREIYLLDFEQASRGGDKTWDIAEFLYYAGHYIPPLAGSYPAELIAKAFIKGYLKAGGDIKAVKDAGKPKYTKVFSVFVFPHIIYAISNICKRADELVVNSG